MLLKCADRMSNNVDTDQTDPQEQFDLGLQCLLSLSVCLSVCLYVCLSELRKKTELYFIIIIIIITIIVIIVIIFL